MQRVSFGDWCYSSLLKALGIPVGECFLGPQDRSVGKDIAVKTDGLSLIPGTHMADSKLSFDPHLHAWHILAHIHAHANNIK